MAQRKVDQKEQPNTSYAYQTSTPTKMTQPKIDPLSEKILGETGEGQTIATDLKALKRSETLKPNQNYKDELIPACYGRPKSSNQDPNLRTL